MGKTSCIRHLDGDKFFQVRDSYVKATGDVTSAAIMHMLEYWTNARIECHPGETPWVSGKTARNISDSLFGLCNEKTVRDRIKQLEKKGFITTRQKSRNRKTLDYLLNIEKFQLAVDLTREEEASQPFSNGNFAVKNSNGKITNGKITVENQITNGKITAVTNGKNAVGTNGKITVASLYIESSSSIEEIENRERVEALEAPLSDLFFLNEEEDALSEADASESCPEESQGEEVGNISSLIKRQSDCNKHRKPDPKDKCSAPVLQQAQKSASNNNVPEWAMGQNDDGTFQASRDFVAWLANSYWVAKGDKYAKNKSYARAYLEKAGKASRANELWEEYQSRIEEIEFVAQLREQMQMKPVDSGKPDRITDEERVAKFNAIQEQILALKNKVDS